MSFILTGMMIHNMMSVHAASSPDTSAIQFNDRFLDVYMTESGKAWAVGHSGKIIYSDNF